MSGAADVARLHRKLDRAAREFDGRALEERLLKLGKEASRFVDDAVKATPAKSGSLGDGSMSGWRRGRPFQLQGRAKAVGRGGKPTVVVMPAPKALGPMRVLEDGRKARGVGSLYRKGQYTSKKTGATYSRLGVTKRNVGATEGKKTWTHATTVMARYVPPAGRREFVNSWKKALS